jgi:hypothetical protein
MRVQEKAFVHIKWFLFLLFSGKYNRFYYIYTRGSILPLLRQGMSFAGLFYLKRSSQYEQKNA